MRNAARPLSLAGIASMQTLLSRIPAVVALLLLLGGCAPAAAPAGPAPQAASAPTLDELYARAVANAAVYSPEHVLPLLPATPDSAGFVRVATLTTWNYPPGEQELRRAVWVSVVPEVRDSCLTWEEEGAALTMRLRQLIGLRPADSVSHFVEMTVPAAALFRPTVDPAATTIWPCPEGPSGGACGLHFPAGVDSAHVAWMANQMLSAWQVPNGYPADTASGGGRGTLGYPWTRLGYTYNWHPGSPRYGASEYLVRAGSRIRVDAIFPIAAYCARP
jgi:hypothetical protein